MFLRLLRDWKGYRAGKVFEPTLGVAQILIRRGIAAEADPAPFPDTADAEPTLGVAQILIRRGIAAEADPAPSPDTADASREAEPGLARRREAAKRKK